MTSNEILQADLLDILFDNRNKQYGAYTLRRNYNYRLTLALGLSLSSVLLLFLLFPSGRIRPGGIVHAQPDVTVTTVDLPEPVKKIIPPPVTKTPQKQFSQQRFTKMIIVNKQTVDPPPDLRLLEQRLISTRTLEGPPAVPGISMVEQDPPAPAKAESENSGGFVPVEREPQFPGGQRAWLQFLQRNLVAPEELEAGERKTVSIRFFVAIDGAVTAFQVLQSAGKSFDNEVIRVLKKMPKWTPALQNGQPVARAFTQPVTFVGLEQ